MKNSKPCSSTSVWIFINSFSENRQVKQSRNRMDNPQTDLDTIPIVFNVSNNLASPGRACSRARERVVWLVPKECVVIDSGPWPLSELFLRNFMRLERRDIRPPVLKSEVHFPQRALHRDLPCRKIGALTRQSPNNPNARGRGHCASYVMSIACCDTG